MSLLNSSLNLKQSYPYHHPINEEGVLYPTVTTVLVRDATSCHHFLCAPRPSSVSKMRQSQVKCNTEYYIERDDSSFRVCICTLLLLLALFGVTAMFLWKIEEQKVPVSYKVLSHPPSSDSASWLGKIVKNEIKTTSTASIPVSPETPKPSTALVTKESEHSTITDEERSSTVDLLSSVKTSGMTKSTTSKSEKDSFQDDFTKTNEITPSSSSLSIEVNVEASSSAENLKTLSTEDLMSTTDFGETTEAFIHSTNKEESSLFYSTSSQYNFSTSTDLSIDVPSTTQDLSTSKLFERIMEIDKTAELSTTESTQESTLVEYLTNGTETTVDEQVSTNFKTTNSKERSVVDTTLDVVSDTVTAKSPQTSMGTSTTSPKVTSPPLTCPKVTCPTTSCPECPSTTCPTLATSTTLPSTTASPGATVCQSSQCYETAARILSLVNVNIDPCEDFYSYACGGILKNPTLLENNLEEDVWRRIERAVKNISTTSPGSHQKLRNFYDGCVNYDNLVSMEERKKQGRKVLDDVAQFADSSSTPENDFTELLIKLFQHGSKPLFDLALDVDSSNSSQFQLVVTVPNWVQSHFLDRTERCRPSAVPAELVTVYEDYKHCMGNFSEFIDTTQKALEFFGVFDYLPAYNASQLIQEIRMSMEFDILELLREYPSPDVVNKDMQSKIYKLTPKIQLESELPMIAWSYLFSTLLNVEVSDAANIQVYFVDYIKTFFSQLQTKSVRTVHNSLLAMFAHNLYTDLVLTHKSCSREGYCLRVTSKVMPEVVSNLYLESFPIDEDRELRKQVVLVYQQLEAAMEGQIAKATWLDDKTSNEISKKLKFMSIQLPRKFNDSILDSSLGECDLGGQHYLNDSVCLVKQLQLQLFSRYTLDPHSSHAMWPYFLTAFSTKPAFIYGLNTFMIPLAVIRPVYDPQMPKHVVMATLGNVLARGIGHNFDHTGVKFVAGGKIGMMLSEATNPTYEVVVENSNLQFSWTKSHREDSKVYSYLLDPQLTLNQRLSDITAVNLSLSTVLNTTDTVLPWSPFPPEQTYFLVLAQRFCSKKKMPDMFTTLYEETSLLPFDRVFNMAANSEQFALAFRCRMGTTMNMATELKTRPFPIFDKDDLYVPDYS